jgi:hypothetical protein
MADADTSLDFLPISERQEWADVRPLAPPATPQPVVAIGRDLLLGDLMDYFWAAVAAKECRWVGKQPWCLGLRVKRVAGTPQLWCAVIVERWPLASRCAGTQCLEPDSFCQPCSSSSSSSSSSRPSPFPCPALQRACAGADG